MSKVMTFDEMFKVDARRFCFTFSQINKFSAEESEFRTYFGHSITKISIIYIPIYLYNVFAINNKMGNLKQLYKAVKTYLMKTHSYELKLSITKNLCNYR